MKKKKTADENQIASSIMGEIIKASEEAPTKNPAAVALGRLGGLKGGHARAAALTKKRRQEIARKAIATRWAKAKKSP